MREIYTCPDHGAVSYGVTHVTVQEWNDLRLAYHMKQAVDNRAMRTLEGLGIPLVDRL